MTSLFKRLGLALGVTAGATALSAAEPSPMQNHQKIDFVAHDPKSDRVILAMVESRSWGEKGALLPDLQQKLNTYLGYALGGQLAKDYPQLKDKKVRFLLQTKFPLTEREEHFIEIVKKKHFEPRDIEWEVRLLGISTKKE